MPGRRATGQLGKVNGLRRAWRKFPYPPEQGKKSDEQRNKSSEQGIGSVSCLLLDGIGKEYLLTGNSVAGDRVLTLP
jgi:hypothetical protein